MRTKFPNLGLLWYFSIPLAEYSTEYHNIRDKTIYLTYEIK